MFKEDMVAPCGLNCGICHEALRKENPCTGCLGPNETKSDYCANHCKISVCDIRQTLPDRFCDQCPQFPCSEMTDKEIWYANTYPCFRIQSNIGFPVFLFINFAFVWRGAMMPSDHAGILRAAFLPQPRTRRRYPSRIISPAMGCVG